MKTAEEIIVNYDGEYFQGAVFGETAWPYKECIAMINEARKEAIEECANKAEKNLYNGRPNKSPQETVTAILSLIEELK